MTTYTKTAWANDNPPALDETNLGKVEQGIADAHSELDTHEANTSNPHVVTASQAGAEPLGSVATHAALTTGVHGLVKNNLTATAAPSATDDASAGYAVKSLWMDQTNGNIYQCMDATTGAAVWKNLTAAASGAYHDYGTITSGTLAIEVDKYDYIKATIGADTTISFTGWPSSGVGAVTVELVNGGAYTVTLPTIRTAGGSGLSLTTSGTDTLLFLSIDSGTTIDAYQPAEDIQ